MLTIRCTQNMREHNGVHTCDRRRSRSDIQAAFPEYHFEEGFTESDRLWTPHYRETHDDIDRRAKHVLDMIFQNDREQCGCCLISLWWDSLGAEAHSRFCQLYRSQRMVASLVVSCERAIIGLGFYPQEVRASICASLGVD